MRVAVLVPVYALISLMCLCFPKAAVYLDPWYDLAEANALVAFFLLMCEYVSPHHDQRADFFNTIEISDKKAREKGVDGATWFKVCLHKIYTTIFFLVPYIILTLETATLVHGLPVPHHCHCLRRRHRRHRGCRCLLPVRDVDPSRKAMGTCP